MKIYNDDFNKLNFCDFNITEMYIDQKLKIINIILEGAYYGKLKILSDLNIKIFSWKSISILMYEPYSKKAIDLNENNYDPLSRICESKLDEKLILNGFGKKTGFWVEYEIYDPGIEVFFKNSDELSKVLLRDEKLMQLNKLVTHFLRHSPSDYELSFDENGWVSINELLQVLKLKKSQFFMSPI